MDIPQEIFIEGRLVLSQMAPYLLFGFLMAGIISVLLSPEWVERHLGGNGMWPVAKASLFGVPLPLCSCSVIPVSASIRRHGASRAATTAFLLSTPQTGVDSIAVTYALLGPVFAIFRPLVALFTGLIGGALVRLFSADEPTNAAPAIAEEACADSCYAARGQPGTFKRAVQYGYITLPKDIALPLLLGVLIASGLAAFVPEKALGKYLGGGIFSILILMAAGVPVYVCATASVPIALGLMHMGASPGAAFAFLIAGPATNAATIAITWKVLGKGAALIYLITVAASAFGGGILLDALMSTPQNMQQLQEHKHGAPAWFYHASVIVLLAVLAFSFLSTWLAARKRRLSALEPQHINEEHCHD